MLLFYVFQMVVFANLAQSPARPENVRIANARELENHTVLAWDPVIPECGYKIENCTYKKQ